MIKIRAARPTDLAAIEACAVAAYQRYVDAIGREPAPMVADFAGLIQRGVIFVAERQNRMGGFVVFYPGDDHMHLENVAVAPDFQQCGIGSRLLEFAEQQAKAQNFAQIELYTNAKMTANLEFYPRRGYEQFDRRIEAGFDRVYFKKKL